MSYVKAYVLSVGSLLGALGALLLVLSAINTDPLALYFVYMALLAGLAGPIRVGVEKGKNAK